MRVYRKVRKLNSPKPNDPKKKWENELSRQFSKEKVQIANKYMKKCSTSLGIKEMQIKTTFRFYHSEWLSSRTQTTTNVGEDAGKKESSYTAGGNVS
jgi:hypothetical protein